MNGKTKLDASVIIRIARPEGLIPVLSSLAYQDFKGTWEVVIVDAYWAVRKEVVGAYWAKQNIDVDLVHVAPLTPLNDRPRHCWDIPLYMNTGWAYARGQVCIHIEDYMVVRNNWVTNHYNFIKHHPNLIGIGHVYNEPIFDDDAPSHYGREKPAELLFKMGHKLLHQFQHPREYQCVNAHNYGLWLSGNMACATEHILRINGVAEISTHYPESIVSPYFFAVGLSMWPLEGVPAWHIQHTWYTTENVFTQKADGSINYELVIQEDFNSIINPPVNEFNNYRRNLRNERIKLDRWI